MEDTRQLRLMLLVSVIAHIVILGIGILLHTFRSQAVPVSLPNNAQVVELYDVAEIPELPVQEPEPIIQEPQQEQVVALQTISPDPTPTPTPELLPTPTPRPTSTPEPSPTPTPILPTPTPHKRPAQSEEKIATLEVPRRRSVIQPRPPENELPSVWRREPQPPQQEQQPAIERSDTPTPQRSFSYSPRSSTGTPMTFETENEFPYPEYLEHIKNSIEEIWVNRQGTGTISIFLIIGKNGEILNKGIDKGTGVGVNKLRDSISRPITLIKRFHPLPAEYKGMVLRVRIIVRR